MGANVDLNVTVEDMIEVDQTWNSDLNDTEYVVSFLGVEVGTYQTNEWGQAPEGFTASDLVERGEKLVRALWALGEADKK